jgi:glycosyltransferase involved in cell wall biosynthesis
MSDQPRISIVTVSYNQCAFLEKALRSVIDQAYPNLEYIVIDGGSTDGSADLIRKYEKHLKYWVSEKDRGQSHALNKGFARCSGEMMGWLNSDDYYLPGALARFAAAWREDPDAGAWVGDANLVDLKGRVVKVQRPGDLDAESLAQWEKNGFSQPACLFSRRAWEKAGGIDESLFIAMDFDLWMRIAAVMPFRRIPAVLAGAVVHAAAKTQAHVPRNHVERWQVVMRHGYHDIARQDMLRTLERMQTQNDKLARLTNSPPYRLFRPLIKAVFR